MNDTLRAQAVRAAQAGDQRAFESLFRAHRDGLYSLVLHFMRDPERAADVTQDAFVRAWEQLPKLREPEAFGGWLRSMAMNLVRDHYRRARDTQPLDEDAPIAGDGPDPPALAEQSEHDRAVREAVLALPEHQRTVVAMHHLEGIPVRDIVDALGIPKGTVVSRLARGREALRRRLAPYIDRPGER